MALGRALIREPAVFLFDEPFSNLDAALRVRMRGEIKELHQRLGVTSVFVTHDQEEAMSISDRVAVMRAGRVEQVGTPEDVYARPESALRGALRGQPPDGHPAQGALRGGAGRRATGSVRSRSRSRRVGRSGAARGGPGDPAGAHHARRGRRAGARCGSSSRSVR